MSNNSAGGGDDLRTAADRLRREAENIGNQLDDGVGPHVESITPELKQTMDDISGVVSDLAGKAKGILGSLAAKADNLANDASRTVDDAGLDARAAVRDAGRAPDDLASGAGEALRDAARGADATASRIARGADTGVAAAKDAASKGSEWLEKTIGMSADELVERARAYGDDVADSVKEVVEGVQRTGEQARRAKDETLN